MVMNLVQPLLVKEIPRPTTWDGAINPVNNGIKYLSTEGKVAEIPFFRRFGIHPRWLFGISDHQLYDTV